MGRLNPETTALIVVDVQKAFDHWERTGAVRNNPDALQRIADLIERFRRARAFIFHIRHRGTSPESFFRGEGCEPMPEAAERQGEPVLWKSVNSSFIGTNLEQRLRDRGIRTVVICGATSNHCVETTTRMAGNLGFDAKFVSDATWTFDRRGPDGKLHRADDIQAMTESNLSDEFAEIVTTAEILSDMPTAKEAVQ